MKIEIENRKCLYKLMQTIESLVEFKTTYACKSSSARVHINFQIIPNVLYLVFASGYINTGRPFSIS